MKVKIQLFAVAGVVMASVAQANVWDDFSQRFDQDVNASLSFRGEGQAEAEKRYQDLLKQVSKVRAQQDKEVAKLAQEQSTYDQLQLDQGNIQKDLAQLQNESTANMNWIRRGMRDSEIQDKERKLAEIQRRVPLQEAKRNQMEVDLKKIQGQLADEQSSANKFQTEVLDKKNESYKSAFGNEELSGAAMRVANSMLNRQQQNGYTADLLLTDLNVLKQQNRLNDLQASMIKQLWGNQLNSTLMGQYVNSQIQKAVSATCDPQFQSACTAKKTSDLQQFINSKLSPPEVANAAQASSNTEKAAAPASQSSGVNAPASTHKSGAGEAAQSFPAGD